MTRPREAGLPVKRSGLCSLRPKVRGGSQRIEEG